MRPDSNKPLFIITPVGEFGPFTPDEILRQVGKGEILRTDRLRTSDGQLIGTVSDIESGKIRVVVAPAGGGSDPVAKRVSSSPRIVPPSGRHTRQSPAPTSGPSWIVGGVLAAVSLGIVGLVLSSGSSPRTVVAPPPSSNPSAPATAAQPKIALTIAERRPGSVDVRVASDQPLGSSLTVRIGLVGDTAGARLEPADGRVVLGPGNSTAKITVVAQGEADGPRAVRLLLATSSDYQALGFGTLEVKVDPAIPEVVKPSIAWESFAYPDTNALLQGEGGHGWAGRWSGSGLVAVTTPLPMPTGFPGPTPNGHVLVASTDGKANFAWRSLSQRWSSGTVWVSCLVQGQRRSDGVIDWSTVGFEDRGKSGGFSIASQCTKDRTQWFINAPQPDDKSVPRYQLGRVADISVPVRMVVRLDLGASSASIAYWINPSPGQEPKSNPNDTLTTVPPLGFDRVTLYANRNSAIRVADLRIGRTWREVLPQR